MTKNTTATKSKQLRRKTEVIAERTRSGSKKSANVEIHNNPPPNDSLASSPKKTKTTKSIQSSVASNPDVTPSYPSNQDVDHNTLQAKSQQALKHFRETSTHQQQITKKLINELSMQNKELSKQLQTSQDKQLQCTELTKLLCGLQVECSDNVENQWICKQSSRNGNISYSLTFDSDEKHYEYSLISSDIVEGVTLPLYLKEGEICFGIDQLPMFYWRVLDFLSKE